jgi:hypothetical protein
MKSGTLLIAFILFCTVAARAQTIPAAMTKDAPPANNAASPSSKSVGALRREKAEPVSVPRFEKPPAIDGLLDDEAWQHAAVLKDFYQTQPGDNIAPSYQTEVLVGYDTKTLFIALRAHDASGKVRSTVAKRDDVLNDDNVRVYLDTYNDQRKAYVLIFNPLGVQQDGIRTEGVGEDYSVDIVMESKGVVGADGYTVEAAIPFKSLRYEAGKGKLWGIHVVRSVKHVNDEQNSWMPLARDESGFLNQEGHLTGFEGLSTERTLELIPSITLSEAGTRMRSIPTAALNENPALLDPGRFVNQPIRHDLGLTGKIGVTPTTTLAFTINPDFAQIEADEIVVTANQRFPIFYQEKRPFFLEGKEIFETPLNAVHTRAIISPSYAMKLTGKRGRNTFGMLVAADNGPGNYSQEERADPELLPSIRKFLDKKAYIGVLRLKHDVGQESYIGVIATSYNFIEDHNQLAGFDGRFRLNPQTTFAFQVLGTSSRGFFFDPERGKNIYRTGNAFAYYYQYERSGRHWGYGLSGLGRTRDYRADVGFTRRTNSNKEEFFISYNSEPNPKAALVQWQFFNRSTTNFDWQGRSQLFNNSTDLFLNFSRQTFLALQFGKGYERVLEEEFGPKRTASRAGAFFGDDSERSADNTVFAVTAETTPSKKYSVGGDLTYTRGALDFDFGAGPRFPRVSPAALLDPGAPLDPGAGNELAMSLRFNYQPTDALRLSFNYTTDKLRRNDTGRLAFDEHIFTFRSTYQFTRFLFTRARVDYDELASNMRGQFLLGWTPNPGTAFYVGYNDDLNRNGFNPFTGQFEPGFRRNNRTFFIKASYLFRCGLSNCDPRRAARLRN